MMSTHNHHIKTIILISNKDIMTKASTTIKKETMKVEAVMKEKIIINVLVDTIVDILKMIDTLKRAAVVDILKMIDTLKKTAVVTVVQTEIDLILAMAYIEWKTRFISVTYHKKSLKKILQLILDQLVLSRLTRN